MARRLVFMVNKHKVYTEQYFDLVYNQALFPTQKKKNVKALHETCKKHILKSNF